MFVLMASLLDRSGVAKDLYNAMRVWAGGLRGGVGIQTLLAAVVLAAMTGIIGGEIVLLGLIALPQMLRLGYDKKISMGIVVAGGSLGTMIPPSIVLIMYGLITGTPISDLFLATVNARRHAGVHLRPLRIHSLPTQSDPGGRRCRPRSGTSRCSASW